MFLLWELIVCVVASALRRWLPKSTPPFLCPHAVPSRPGSGLTLWNQHNPGGGLSLSEAGRLRLCGLQSWPPCGKPKALLKGEATGRGHGEAPGPHLARSWRPLGGAPTGRT